MTKCLMSICLLHTPSALRNVFCTVPLKSLDNILYMLHYCKWLYFIWCHVGCYPSAVLLLCYSQQKNWKLVLFKQNSHVTFSCTLYFVLIIKS